MGLSLISNDTGLEVYKDFEDFTIDYRLLTIDY